ncbi:MAG: hypothetical protein ACFCBW_00505 [Candidatus Competibacterales bacterium]
MTVPASSPAVTPIWRRLPVALFYPLQRAAFYVCTGAALLALLPVPFLPLLVSLFFTRYAFAVLEQVALGEDRPPALDGELWSTGLGLPVKYFLLMVILLLVGLQVLHLGTEVGLIYLLVVMLLLPASTMVLAMERRLGAALNPGFLLATVARLGMNYLLLYGLLILVSLGYLQALNALASLEQQTARTALLAFLTQWLGNHSTLVTFYLMGYLIYQRQEELGFEAEANSQSRRQREAHPWAAPLAQGDWTAAAGELEQYLRWNSDDLDAQLAFHRVLLKLDNRPRVREQGRLLIHQLLEARRRAEAVTVYLACHQLDGEFVPRDGQHVEILAQMLRQRRQFDEALDLLNGFTRANLQDPTTPELYLLALQILVEDLGQFKKALAVADFVESRYPEHRCIAQVKIYRGIIERGGAATPKS